MADDPTQDPSLQPSPFDDPSQPETPPPAQPQPPEAPPSTAVRDAAAAHFNTDLSDFPSDKEFLDNLGQLWQQTQQIDPNEVQRLKQLEPLANQYMQHADEFQHFLASREAPQQTPAAQQQYSEQQAAEKKWGPPQLSETTQRLISSGMITEDPSTGLYRVRQNEDPTVAANFQHFVKEANEVTTWRRSAADRLVNDPLGALEEAGLSDRLTEREKALQEQYDQRISQLESKLAQLTEPQQQEHEQELAKKMFKVNGVGKIDYESPTPLGQLYRHTARAQMEMLRNVNPDLPEEEVRRLGHQAGLQVAQQHEEIYAQGETPTETPSQPAESDAERQRKERHNAFLDRTRRGNGHGEAPTTVATTAAREDPLDSVDEDQLWEQEVGSALR